MITKDDAKKIVKNFRDNFLESPEAKECLDKISKEIERNARDGFTNCEIIIKEKSVIFNNRILIAEAIAELGFECKIIQRRISDLQCKYIFYISWEE